MLEKWNLITNDVRDRLGLVRRPSTIGLRSPSESKTLAFHHKETPRTKLPFAEREAGIPEERDILTKYRLVCDYLQSI